MHATKEEWPGFVPVLLRLQIESKEELYLLTLISRMLNESLKASMAATNSTMDRKCYRESGLAPSPFETFRPLSTLLEEAITERGYTLFE